MFNIFTIIIIILGVCQMNTAKCRHKETKIVGGMLTEIDKFPYTVSLRSDGKHFCGGTIISEVFVISAGHCLYGMQPSWMYVHVGTSFLDQEGQVCEVLGINQHPTYTGKDYDISIITLKKKIIFSDKVGKLRLPRPNEGVEIGVRVIVTGWGQTKFNGTKSNQLRYVRIPIMDFNVCKGFYEKKGLTDRMFCAGEYNGGVDSCQGDSGGPLMSSNILFGVISWGVGCAFPQNPGVYTKIQHPAIRKFIKDITNL